MCRDTCETCRELRWARCLNVSSRLLNLAIFREECISVLFYVLELDIMYGDTLETRLVEERCRQVRHG